MKRFAPMVSAVLTSVAILVLVPATASAASDNSRPGARGQRVVHRAVMPASAVALFPSILVPVVRPDDDSDGLTRNQEECNRGCIDNN